MYCVSKGPNFDLAHRRLRKEWYMRWMDEPRSVTPNTKMPDYSENWGIPEHRHPRWRRGAQFDAIWHYLQGVSR